MNEIGKASTELGDASLVSDDNLPLALKEMIGVKGDSRNLDEFDKVPTESFDDTLVCDTYVSDDEQSVTHSLVLNCSPIPYCSKQV